MPFPTPVLIILLNQQDTAIAGITGLKTTYAELNLGKSFDYAGIQFFPGVWQGDRNETQDRFVGTPYAGQLPLIEMNRETAVLAFADKGPVLTRFVARFAEQGVIAQTPTVKNILTHLDAINSVAEMADLVHHSPRQLQRILKQATGFSPHDFLKVMRLQQSLRAHHIDLYTDQSHFIRSFKKSRAIRPPTTFLSTMSDLYNT